MNRFSLLVFAFACLAPIAAWSATIESSAIPNGTYTVKVQKVVDPKHVDVLLSNGSEATLPAGRASVDFSKVQINDQLELSVIGGNVMVFIDLTNH